MIFANVKEWLIPEGYVKKVVNSSNITLWEKSNTDYSNTYFFVEDASGSNNTLSITKHSSSAPDITVYYSTDETNWNTLGTTSMTELTTTIPANGKVYLKANTDSWRNDISSGNMYFNKIIASGNYNVGGNIMSLLYGDNFSGITEFPTDSSFNFSGIFRNGARNNTTLISAENLILPATTLTDYCYYEMFEYCTALTTAPELPATTLVDNCYKHMFVGCSSLATTPNLPATTLADYCYSGMFSECTSLTTAPELPATELAYYCYQAMFSDCTALTTAPNLPATTLADKCYAAMFSDCTALTTAPNLPATTLADSCYYYMFVYSGLTTAPNLPATTLAKECYSRMFESCSSLTTAPELPATTLAYKSNYQMFRHCTALTTAPTLYATTLADYCYQEMFYGCSNLNSVTTYADDISATDCLKNWLYGVADSGDFYNNGSATYETDSASGIPTGWTEHKSEDYSTKYFFVEDTSGSDNTLSIVKANENAPDVTVYYSTDETNWSELGATSTTALTTTIPANGKVYLKANTDAWGYSVNVNNITASGNHNVGGNIMSLLYGDDFSGVTEFPTNSTYNFSRLFNSNTTLVSAENLILPATTLSDYCYYHMFNSCTSLTTAPSLPATTLAEYCYGQMFVACTSLTTAPELPATTLVSGCYISMFQNCTSLTTAPSLPATELVSNCYRNMFYGCTSLTTAPSLPATTLASYCYRQMFQDCSNLNYIKAMFTTTPSTTYTNNWVKNVASSGTFVKNSAATWDTASVTGTNGVPSGWTVEIADA